MPPPLNGRGMENLLARTSFPHLVSATVGQVQLRFLRAEIDSRLLAHHLGIDRLVGLDTHHQLIPTAL